MCRYHKREAYGFKSEYIFIKPNWSRGIQQKIFVNLLLILLLGVRNEWQASCKVFTLSVVFKRVALEFGSFHYTMAFRIINVYIYYIHFNYTSNYYIYYCKRIL